MITSRSDFIEKMQRDLARWNAELEEVGPDPAFEPIREQLRAFIAEGKRLLGPF